LPSSNVNGHIAAKRWNTYESISAMANEVVGIAMKEEGSVKNKKGE